MHGIDQDNLDKEEITKRLIYEEFFLNQIKVESRKKYLKSKRSEAVVISEELLHKITSDLPYQLTTDQHIVLNDILNDFKSGTQMMRIVQGDVGCGKTTVALISH